MSIDALREFHAKFELKPEKEVPHLPTDPSLLLFRLGFQVEELRELTQAIYDRDLVQIADALVDIVYVAIGTAYWLGLPWDALFAEVHRANLAKTRVSRPGADPTARGGVYDVIKPAGWEPPNLVRILHDAGWVPPYEARDFARGFATGEAAAEPPVRATSAAAGGNSHVRAPGYRRPSQVINKHVYDVLDPVDQARYEWDETISRYVKSGKKS